MAKFKSKQKKPTKSTSENEVPKKLSKRATKRSEKFSKRKQLLEKLKNSNAPKEKPLALSGLVHSIEELKDESKPSAPRLFGLRLGKKGVHSTIKKKLVDNESARLKLVLAHPQFKQNPLEAIRGLLTNQIQNESK